MCWGGCSEPGWLSLQCAKGGVQAAALVMLRDLLEGIKPMGSESVWEELFGILISFT